MYRKVYRPTCRRLFLAGKVTRMVQYPRARMRVVEAVSGGMAALAGRRWVAHFSAWVVVQGSPAAVYNLRSQAIGRHIPTRY